MVRFQHHLLAGNPPDKLERPHTDGVPCKLRLRYILPLQEVPGQNGQVSPCREGRGKRFFVGYPEGIPVENLRLAYLPEVLGIGGGGLLIDDGLIAEVDVVSSKLDAIAPPNPLPQVKGNGEAVFRDIPRLGKVTDYGEVRIVLDEAVDDETGNIV